MFAPFCEFPGGKDGVCGLRTLGKCYVCGRHFCSVHGKISEGMMICYDCEGMENHLEEDTEKWAKAKQEEEVDNLYLEPEESVDLHRNHNHRNHHSEPDALSSDERLY